MTPSFKTLIFILALLLYSFSAYTQDQIVLKNDSVIDCHFSEFNSKSLSIKADPYFGSIRHSIPFAEIKELKISPTSSKFKVFNDSVLMKQMIEIKQKGLGMALYSKDRKLSNFEIRALLISNEEEYLQFTNGRSFKITGAIVGVTGGVITVASALVLTGPDQLNMYFLAIGGSAMIVGIACSTYGNKLIKKAIAGYNSDKPLSQAKLNFGFQQNGFGFSYHF